MGQLQRQWMRKVTEQQQTEKGSGGKTRHENIRRQMGKYRNPHTRNKTEFGRQLVLTQCDVDQIKESLAHEMEVDKATKNKDNTGKSKRILETETNPS